MDSTPRKSIEALSVKEDASILITDSGFGGLSICADIVSGLHRRPLFENAFVTYFNAWPEQTRGYNKFATVEERIRIFDSALGGMQKYQPDLIMIACNTLSALYDRTGFSRRAEIPVVGIIDFGVNLIYDMLMTTPGSHVLILGTRTTITENIHKEMLIKRGIDAGRITTQACDGLASAIEKNPESATVVELADRYIREAASKMNRKQGKVFVALCCTHFGYIRHMILEKARRHVSENVAILNPNKLMSESLLTLEREDVYPDMHIHLKVVSRVLVDDMIINSIVNLIRDISPNTAKALKNYEYKPDLFEF